MNIILYKERREYHFDLLHFSIFLTFMKITRKNCYSSCTCIVWIRDLEGKVERKLWENMFSLHYIYLCIEFFMLWHISMWGSSEIFLRKIQHVSLLHISEFRKASEGYATINSSHKSHITLKCVQQEKIMFIWSIA